jgi:hypothetical protein
MIHSASHLRVFMSGMLGTRAPTRQSRVRTGLAGIDKRKCVLEDEQPGGRTTMREGGLIVCIAIVALTAMAQTHAQELLSEYRTFSPSGQTRGLQGGGAKGEHPQERPDCHGYERPHADHVWPGGWVAMTRGSAAWT